MTRAAALTVLALAACGDQRVAPVDVREGCPEPPVADVVDGELLVSGFERGLGTLDGAITLDGRWDVGSDDSDPGFVSEVSDTCAASGTRAAHLATTSGLTKWGAYLNLVFRAGYLPMDLRRYRAISFWAATGGVDPRRYELLVGFETRTVNPNGNVCTMCGDVYGTRVQVDRRWRKFRVPFDALMQAGWGKPAGLPLALDEVLDFAVRASGIFDLWIDHVTLEPAP